MTTLSDRAKGRWRSILPLAGVDSKFLTGKHGPCPMCGGRDRFRWTNHKDSGAYYCSACGHGTGIDLVMSVNGIAFKEAAERIEAVIGKSKVDDTRREKSDDELKRDMAALWGLGRPICSESLSARYLAGRGIVLRDFPAALRDVCCPSCIGMIAKVVGPDGKTAVNLHRTFLAKDASKEGRMLMKGALPSGSAIRLMPAGPVLGIAEGIETALSAHLMTGYPVWSLISAGNMTGFRPPEEVSEVVVFGDSDESYTGQAAAYKLAHDLLRDMKRAGRDLSVRVELPQDLGCDWNDILVSRRNEPTGQMIANRG